MPWTRWLTLVFQVVPVFFLVGGYASAASWTRWREAGGRRWTEWVRNRLAAILGPTTAYVMLVLVGRGGAGLGGRRTFAAAVRRLGGRHASVVCAGLPRPADADAGRAGGTPAMGAAGACRPGDCSCGRRRCGACLASADNQLSQLPTVLGSDLSGRDLLARWDFGRPSAGADRRRCRHRARDSARPALLPDQHGRIARRDRAEQFSAHRGVARIRRGTSCGLGRRGARGDTSAAAIAVAAATGRGEQQRDGGVPVADGSGRGRRTCRVPHRAVTAARGRDGTVVGLSVGLAADSACRDDRANGTSVVGPIGVQSCAARDLHAPANVERTSTADRRRRDGDVRAGAPCGRGFRPRRALSGCVRVALRRRSRVD